jgi:enterochelin esterase-like enzyme
MKRLSPLFIGILLIALTACDPLAYNPTPVAVVITVPATETPIPTATNTPTITPTPEPSPTLFTPSPTPFPCDEPTGQYIDVDENESENGRGENLRYRVYVPPCYSSSQSRFPILYLLHGLSYAEDQWEDLGLDDVIEQGIRLGAIPPMVVVMPYLGNLGQSDVFPPDPSYEGFLLDELMPEVQSIFCTIENREHRAIGGISRGGFWALSFAMRHPDIFGIAAGHSAYLPINSDLPPAFDPMELALNETFLQEANLRIWLDNGAGDSAGSGQQLFSARLTQRNIQHSYVVHPTGEHNNDYWIAHMQEYLTFYGREWEHDYAKLPPCSEPSP